MNLHALAAGAVASLTAGALLLAAGCALYGAWHLAHDYQAWADNQRHQRAWRESTEIVTGGPLLLADDEPEPVAASTDPALAWLNEQYPDAPRWEDQ